MRSIDSALGIARDLLDGRVPQGKPPTVDEIVAVRRDFEPIEFDGTDGPDADGFLFQYCEVSWFSEPIFAVGFVRQLEIVDTDGDHEEYSQVVLELRYCVDVELRSVGSRTVWWFRSGGTRFEDWLESVTQDPIWVTLQEKELVEFDLSQESV
ncbi:hypothetical protein [Amycolatopsis decaplanina]|uniref:Uncharacterized protein n=1 Tax=Amycolatopsis decaplanina DSM 44594 TaxID=1284240 RepID=M2Y2A0_9PSEU|nr:hypothetical protein [Amycolatopsis decaplanina]EME55670.1 hypothetical protein H074_25100 [Amycolatopsis decaplanina DSM 44594]